MHAARGTRGAALLAAALLAAVVAGCELLVTFDRSLIPEAGPGSGGATVGSGGHGGAGAHGGTGGHGAAEGGGGAGQQCATPGSCPQGTTCKPATCEAGKCGFTMGGEGTSCTEDGGKVCDGQGSCVECTKQERCTGSEQCDQGKCVPAACKNGKLDQGETDVDCGGSECAPCANGKKCEQYGDCASGHCAGGLCAPCAGHDDCQDADYCEAGGKCVAKLATGASCTDFGAEQCASGYCADGLCCNDACAGGCGVCAKAKGAFKDGECTAVAKDTACRAVAGDCDVAEKCDGQSKACPSDGLIADGKPSTGNKCDPYLCDGKVATCAGSCAGHPDCIGGYWCVGQKCALPKCDDKIKDGQEADVDCGGPSCPGCGLGKNCGQGSDCASGACTAGTCTECTLGAKDCVGDVPRTCDPGGAWQSGPACQGPTPFCCAGSCTGGVVEVTAVTCRTCAVKGDGTLWCWGYNVYGQLGDGTTQSKSSPVQVSALGTSALAVAGGVYHTCAVKADGTLWCWGDNGYGQLGDGTTQSKTLPVQVLALGTSAL
ncbi:MAG: hypothetical protein HY744_01940, partial [Deltaproteobacteria bacterium]|nr:hypothetical protein [Deltaproteobacteria bacterium]